MDENTRPVWGRLESGRSSILGVTTHPDRFTVSGGRDERTVLASEFVSVVRGVETSRGKHALRIEHTAAGVISPVTLFLDQYDAVRRDIEGMRPELLATEPRPTSWRVAVLAVLAVGLALCVLGLVLL